jgi:LCP family protein required for cell wall assembly
VILDRRSLQAARRKEQKRQRRKWPRRLLIGFSCLIIVVALVAVGGFVYAQYRFHQIKKVHARHLVKEAPPGQPFNVLLVGSDSRAFVTNATQIKAFGSAGQEGGQRSDVTIVARIIPATKQVYLLSIPRDLWVDIPNNTSGISGMNRINAAFNGGPDLLIQTIEKDLHIPINHYVAVNFNGFQGMVDALGGVTMDFPTEVKDQYSGLDVTQTGCQLVPGTTSLELVRARHLYYQKDGEWVYDGLSDFSRIQRQDAFFRAVLQKLNASITNPIAVNNFIGAAVSNLTIDDTMSESDLLHLASEFHGLPESSLHTQTLPTYGRTTDGGADVLDEAQPYANDMILGFDLLGRTTTTTTTTTTTPHHATTTTQPTLPPSSVSVEVLNGAHWNQPLASTTASGLRRAGFVVTSVANAPSETVTTTEIEYAEGNEEAAHTVARYLGGPTELAADPQLSGDRVVVTLGSSFTGVTGLASEGATTSTTTTTVPPPASDVYTNTQPEPWNPVPCTLPG